MSEMPDSFRCFQVLENVNKSGLIGAHIVSEIKIKLSCISTCLIKMWLMRILYFISDEKTDKTLIKEAELVISYLQLGLHHYFSSDLH